MRTKCLEAPQNIYTIQWLYIISKITLDIFRFSPQLTRSQKLAKERQLPHHPCDLEGRLDLDHLRVGRTCNMTWVELLTHDQWSCLSNSVISHLELTGVGQCVRRHIIFRAVTIKSPPNHQRARFPKLMGRTLTWLMSCYHDSQDCWLTTSPRDFGWTTAMVDPKRSTTRGVLEVCFNHWLHFDLQMVYLATSTWRQQLNSDRFQRSKN